MTSGLWLRRQHVDVAEPPLRLPLQDAGQLWRSQSPPYAGKKALIIDLLGSAHPRRTRRSPWSGGGENQQDSFKHLDESNRRFLPPPGAELLRKFAVQAQIRQAASLLRGWDGYSAEPPSKLAVAGARRVLDFLQKLGSIPIRAAAMADGGMALVLMARPFYAAIEIYNDGEAVGSFSDRKQRHLAWDVTLEEAPLKGATERLRELMYG
jgi:hypothetical protein